MAAGESMEIFITTKRHRDGGQVAKEANIERMAVDQLLSPNAIVKFSNIVNVACRRPSLCL